MSLFGKKKNNTKTKSTKKAGTKKKSSGTKTGSTNPRTGYSKDEIKELKTRTWRRAGGISDPTVEISPTRTLPVDAPVFLWRGFRHEWGYNHRINRIGSYIRHVKRDATGGSAEARIGHPAASGSGPDEAEVVDYYTELDVQDAWFQTGRTDIRIQSKEGEEKSEAHHVKLKLDENLRGHDQYAVIINGFDLMVSDGSDADKLSSFSLSVTQPVPNASKTELYFDIDYGLNVDCDSPECDGFGPASLLLALASPKVGLLAGMAGKLNLRTDYTLTVDFLIIAGRSDTFQAVEAEPKTNSYSWNKHLEVHRKSDGLVPVVVDDVWDSSVATSTFGFTHLSVFLGAGGGLLNTDNGMHLLEWDMAIRSIESAGTRTSAELLLFFKNWSKGMKMPLVSYRSAGEATLGARLMLLQFKRTKLYSGQRKEARTVSWSGIGADQTAAAARNEVTVTVP